MLTILNGKLKRRNHLGDSGVDGWIVLRWVLKKLGERM